MSAARDSIPHEAQRTPPRSAAANLLANYTRYLRAVHDTELIRYRVTPAGTLTEQSAHHDPSRNELLTVRCNLARTAMWAAVGELQDLRRYLTPQPDLALLLTGKPDADLAAFLRHAAVTVIWPSDRYAFSRLEPNR
ncbi:hypothetical protein [Streptomyces sp. CA-106131]|uniref:hypothetical protein n=1 Tax=Streptomyces sp. CA-106131 TaxID=3240045 RepID=UPI003D8BF711